MLKLAAPVIFKHLTHLFNRCIESSYFPRCFRTSKIIPMFKKGDRNDPLNYRPISIISSLSKPLERHILYHITNHFSSFQHINQKQSGFQKHQSCQTALVRINEIWLQSMNSRKLNGSLFIDFERAFDTINHSILMSKLSCYGFDDAC